MAIFCRNVLTRGLFCGVGSAPDMSSKENLGIVVHYKVKVRLILGFGHRSVSAPATLQQSTCTVFHVCSSGEKCSLPVICRALATEPSDCSSIIYEQRAHIHVHAVYMCRLHEYIVHGRVRCDVSAAT